MDIRPPDLRCLDGAADLIVACLGVVFSGRVDCGRQWDFFRGVGISVFLYSYDVLTQHIYFKQIFMKNSVLSLISS